VGVAGCVMLAISLPPVTLLSGAALFAGGIVLFVVRANRAR
jgi:hypothetical protein